MPGLSPSVVRLFAHVHISQYSSTLPHTRNGTPTSCPAGFRPLDKRGCQFLPLTQWRPKFEFETHKKVSQLLLKPLPVVATLNPSLVATLPFSRGAQFHSLVGWFHMYELGILLTYLLSRYCIYPCACNNKDDPHYICIPLMALLNLGSSAREILQVPKTKKTKKQSMHCALLRSLTLRRLEPSPWAVALRRRNTWLRLRRYPTI